MDYDPKQLFHLVDDCGRPLMPVEFSVDGGELTPTMKLKRSFVSEKYAGLIDSMYTKSA